jgi:hypothetical protein
MTRDMGRPRRARLPGWAAALGPPIVWAIHLNVCYAIVGVFDPSRVLRDVLIGAVTAAVLLVIAISFALGERAARGAPAEDPAPFFARVGRLSAATFAIAVAFTALPIYLLGGGG